ncbi:MAG TPA: hypothetical protein VNV16_08020 [Methylibium sp.]|nr:hypothetical protein [Methylibium sp.]HWH74189.1 hypothetical protein [Methylibium sp.]
MRIAAGRSRVDLRRGIVRFDGVQAGRLRLRDRGRCGPGPRTKLVLRAGGADVRSGALRIWLGRRGSAVTWAPGCRKARVRVLAGRARVTR